MIADGDRDYEKQGSRPAHLVPPPSPALPPEEAIRTIELAPGRHALIQTLASALARTGNPEKIAALLELDAWKGWRGEALLDGTTAGLMDLDEPPALEETPPHSVAELASLLHWPGHGASAPMSTTSRPLTGKERSAYAEGQAFYANLCASCHGPAGRGLAPLGPPLRKSEWVAGDQDRLIRILLHGLEGPIEVAGKRYEPPAILPAMPPVGMIKDRDIAAILTYIRRTWGHGSDPVDSGDVRKVRDLNADRRTAWKVEELLGDP
jgi:mono/diheme cytochrome c family protein